MNANEIDIMIYNYNNNITLWYVVGLMLFYDLF